MKYTYEDIKKFIEDEGYKLLSTKEEIVNEKGYVGIRVKILVKCEKDEHEPYYVDFKTFKGTLNRKGTRCPKCWHERRGEDQRFTYEQVKEYIESFEYKMLDKEYKNCEEKISLECPNGHKWKTTFKSFKRGYRCKKCYSEAVGDRFRVSYEDVKEYIENQGYKLLNETYKNNTEKLDLKCPCGNIYRVSFHSFKDGGHRCPRCSQNPTTVRYEYNNVKKYIESFGYELLSDEYVNCREKLILKCPNGHIYDTTCFQNFKNNNSRCPVCKISKGERKIMKWLDRMCIEYIYDYPCFYDLRGINGGLLRPDFILPNQKIWIEYDGQYHYRQIFEGDSFELSKVHDEIKNKYAKENEWKIIRIPYWDFNNIEDILNNEIRRL